MTSDLRYKIIKILNDFDHYLTIKNPRGEEYQQTRDVSVLELIDLFESELAQAVKEERKEMAEELPPLKDAIEFRIEQYGHSQAEACRIMGITQSHFCEMLRGKRTFTVKVLRRLYKYGIPAEVLIQEEK